MLTRVNVLYRSATRKEQIFIIVRIDAKDDVVGKKNLLPMDIRMLRKLKRLVLLSFLSRSCTLGSELKSC